MRGGLPFLGLAVLAIGPRPERPHAFWQCFSQPLNYLRRRASYSRNWTGPSKSRNLNQLEQVPARTLGRSLLVGRPG